MKMPRETCKPGSAACTVRWCVLLFIARLYLRDGNVEEFLTDNVVVVLCLFFFHLCQGRKIAGSLRVVIAEYVWGSNHTVEVVSASGHE
jgi:hypothetical protein